MTPNLPLARLLALLLPAALLAGAWSFQIFDHLPPCEMCHWQRWPLYAAIVVALLAFATARQVAPSRALVWLAGLLIVTSGALGAYHAGVEWHWWKGPSHCTGSSLAGADPLKALLAARIVQCDVAAWRLFGLSLAGWNALISGLGGLAVLALAGKAQA
jgi:disulfide bond formation protein DsbB